MSKLKSAIYGFAVGDALGVPYEFTPRDVMEVNPATGMIGFGTHQQEPGTWSDDTTFLLCVLEHIMEDGTPSSLKMKMRRCYKEGYLTPHGILFDIGNATLQGIDGDARNRIAYYGILFDIGNTTLHENDGDAQNRSAYSKHGNGSLMRCLPYAFRKDIRKSLYEMIFDHNITHPGSLPLLCSTFYVRMARSLLEGADVRESVETACAYIRYGWRITDVTGDEPICQSFRRLMSKEFSSLSTDEIRSSGYVMDTLEAVCWCLMNTNNYKEAVLKGVNLGGDTDTIAALIGGLAGIVYGMEDIPTQWLEGLQNKALIDSIINRAVAHNEFIS